MRYLMTGATGYLGRRIVERLLARGDRVVGLARDAAAAARLQAAGAEAVIGSLSAPEAAAAALEGTDGAILTAFDHAADWHAAVAQERRLAATLAQALAGSGRLLIATTATGVTGDTGPEPADETHPGQLDFPARPRMAVEHDMAAAAASGVRTVVIRPPVLLHGHGASQFVPLLLGAARKNGVSGYIGEGHNRIAAGHVDDVADLYLLAAERAQPGALYNAAAEDVSTRDLATAVSAAAGADVPARSVTPQRAIELWTFFPALLLGIDNRASGARARRELGWRPYAGTPRILDDIAGGSYAASSGR